MDKKCIANRLKELRGVRTQEEVAEATGITISAISMYECAQRVPRDEIKKKLSDYYDETIQAIFFD